MSPPVGPTGCEGPAHAAGAPIDRWLFGVGAGGFASELSFGDGRDVDIEQQSAAVSIGYRINPRLSVRGNAGVIVDGSLRYDGSEFDVGHGWLITASVAHRWDIGRVFVTGSVSLGASFTETEQDDLPEEEAELTEETLIASDARLGVIAGTTLWDRVSPYLLARAFAGPVAWAIDGEDVTGSDKHHYQIGGGISLALPANLGLQVDVSALGERSLSVGVALAL